MPVKLVSEATRAREAFKYEPFLLRNYQFVRDGNLPRRSEQTTLSDPVLIALAQLATYRTSTERAFVSLFDESHQYIVAEAKQTTQISPCTSSDAALELCGSAIPRQQGTCNHVLYLSTDHDTSAEPGLPVSLVPDLAEDERFRDRPYYPFGNEGLFYAGVPIRTRRGVDIGAFCVTATKQPQSWTEEFSQQLRDISRAIMDHFDLKRSEQQARQNARMNRGLGSFVEGKATLSGWQSGANLDAFKNDEAREGGLDERQQHIEAHHQEIAQDADEAPASLVQSETPSKATSRTKERSSPKRQTSRRPSEGAPISEGHLPGHVFSKAANIIRESFEVEGCVFLDAPASSQYSSHSIESRPPVELQRGSDHRSSTSSSDEQCTTAQDPSADEMCDVFGFAGTGLSSINEDSDLDTQGSRIPKKLLAKLFRRYPTGRIFNFDGGGDLQSSDSSGEDGLSATSPGGAGPLHSMAVQSRPSSASPSRSHGRGRYGQKKEGALIRKAFPSSRSVAFIPLWDQRRERWLSGGFIYTHAPTRIFSLQDDISFLTAFGKLIVAEVLSLETLQADKAKSDVLGSLSHELRSPLHGVLLGTELIKDTDLSVFQGNAVHTIETCGRTMLDTIEHMLDYAKVNSFADRNKQLTHSRPSTLRNRSRSEQFGKKSLYKHIRLDGLVEDVVGSIFAGYNFQHTSLQHNNRQEESGLTDHVRTFSDTEDTSSNNPGQQRAELGDIAVYVSVDPTCDWLFHTQPGALRRIIMNLFGNSLKYTDEGIVRVTLSQEPQRRSTAEKTVKITVHDTGRGIGQDYLQHKLYKSFSQEDELSPGTGLGLSLVKIITSQLRGQIDVQSKVGVGTTVTVTLPLEPSRISKGEAEQTDASYGFDEELRELEGLRVRVLGFESGRGEDARALVDDICRRWLHMELISNPDEAVDIVLWSQDALPDSYDHIAKAAICSNVVVCHDAPTSQRVSLAFEKTGQSQNFDFTSQPVGPRALARSLLLAYKRWASQSKLPSRPRPSGPLRSQSLNWERPQSEMASSSGPHPALHSDADGNKPQTSVTHAAEAAGATQEEVTTKFLLVDDNNINLKVLSAYMRKLGRTYETALNGKEAVDTYTQHPRKFEGILMDISMPVMDGLEATRHIRAHERKQGLKPVPVVALTGLASHSVQQQALESGVNVFLTKPVNMQAIDKALKSIQTSPTREEDG